LIPLRDSIRSRRFPVMTVAIIAVNVAVYFYQGSLSSAGLGRFFMEYGVIPANVVRIGTWLLSGRWAFAAQALGTLVTSMFVHGGLLHLGGNMLYLWVFGDNIEDRLGSGRYLLFYLLTGIIATLTHAATDLGSTIPLIGASGAIAGILGAYLITFPGSRVLTLVPLFFFLHMVEIPAMIFLAFWFILQVFNGVGSLSPGAVESTAWWAHIGGFASGMLLIRLMGGRRQRRPTPTPWDGGASDGPWGPAA